MISLRDQELLRQRFERDLKSRVRIDYFTQKQLPFFVPGRRECAYCQDVRTVLEELASLSNRIALTVHDFEEDADAARELDVDNVPGIVIRGQNNRPVRFFGAPLGNQFTGLVETMLDAASGAVELQAGSVKQLRRLKSDVSLQIMVTPACPYSPAVARTALKLGLQSVRVKVEVTEVSEFPALIERYTIRAVPTTVIDEKTVLPGALDEATLVETLLRVAEGRPQTSPIKVGALSPLNFTSPQQAQQKPPVRTVGSSGLIVPR